ncbi:replication initiation and membrane attachment family protein [Ectobacillus sp. JY-23]|uniref:replication initiation and membrane attachment family protein n=1 Tax=Ectobacillus sp. JY-23 TaxID=2933872 RepID=UPI001FF6AEC7|nr:replication initiation and membrane attachment family protein [Ectobacillus sp. JY-23]UOY94264.1 replication initiation and membrane attachment family protein [Ectobacillus sp. JY-23]
MERQSWMELLPVDRYKVCAAGLLHAYDRKVLTMLYQPLIGARAFSLYMTLWCEVEQGAKEAGHHMLMVSTGMQLPDIYQERTKLEALGLLKVYVKREDDVRRFVYELYPPLTPRQFFAEIVLNIFLYNRLGKSKYNQVKQYFSEEVEDLTSYKEVTYAFNDVFQPIASGQMAQLQEELATPEGYRVAGAIEGNAISISNDFFDYKLFVEGLSPLIPKKALTANVKDCIITLAYIYGIDPISMQNLVLGAITEQNMVELETLRKNARDWYQFEQGSALPTLVERTQPLQQRTMHTKEPTGQEELLIKHLEELSPRQLLVEIAGGAQPTVADLKVIEEVMTKQKLLPGVVNVLIHYVMLRTDMKLTKSYVERIAGHWARKKVKTVKAAMTLAKEEHRQYQQWAEGKKQSKRTTRKEMLPTWMEQKTETSPQTVDLNVEEQRKQLEAALQKYKKE